MLAGDDDLLVQAPFDARVVGRRRHIAGGRRRRGNDRGGEEKHCHQTPFARFS